ncbi:hypothetical protein AEA09_14750 [Lysinibacillus contaminans]|uniref:DUF2382 domain-containing protein n=1 Tax=Lysinibacillus contaminans TaxID=1293441 RepID=A0ABR5JY87_9BACI|nr:DUF2382 domain-containing protein [Lysinibacillus contaminans]KOS67110.1 hypothetical protein AEA09_14750 [Lysinibacillus contaminans]
METRDNKLYGVYNNEMELQEEMDRLRAQGYGEEDMYIVSNHNEQLSMYRGSTSYVNETKEGSWWDRFKAFMMGEDLVRDQYFAQMGLTDEERNRYYDELQAGKYLLYVDKHYGSYFDEGTKNYGMNNVFARDYEKMDEERLALHEERLHVDKKRVQTGEVHVEKHVVEEQQTVEVPVEREEVYVERRPVDEEVRDVSVEARDGMAHAYEEEGRIHIPVTEERVEVTKKDVVTEEIIVGKRIVTDTETVSDTVRREEADIHDTTNNLEDSLNRTDRRY